MGFSWDRVNVSHSLSSGTWETSFCSPLHRFRTVGPWVGNSLLCPCQVTHWRWEHLLEGT